MDRLKTIHLWYRVERLPNYGVVLDIIDIKVSLVELLIPPGRSDIGIGPYFTLPPPPSR